MRSLRLDESRQRADLLAVTSYDVTLDLAGDDKTFTSSTKIKFMARQTGDTFVDVKPKQLVSARLNGSALDVDELVDGRLPITGISGEQELVIEAVMAYRTDGEGMHRAIDPADGRQYTYAMSFLDAAPNIFACFDQPDLKAPFTLHVRTPLDWIVVGNGRAEEVEPGVWELATTQPLSTYFVTLVAGPYFTVASEHDGIRLGLECRASLAEHLEREADEILTITRQCFDEYHRLFDIRYPFGDYHQAFVPEFNAGAMENAGCVTFRDPLVFASNVTRHERTSRATTIAHEMAHMWFGDLVTPRWWDDLWLNESFAEYMGNRVTNDATEFKDAWVDVALRRKRWGIEADQRPTTHPVAGTGALDAQAALQDFDGISYAKGSAILKQLSARLGDEVFLAGVREHLTRNRFGNASMNDLFSAWETAGAGDMDEWIHGWLRTAGLDLLQLEHTAGELQVVRTSPPTQPANRQHAISVAHHSGDRWLIEPLVVASQYTPVPAPVGRPVLLDPAEETWARIMLDEGTLEALPGLLPDMSDPLMRAAVWNAVRDGTWNALISPTDALHLVGVALPNETQDLAIASLGQFGVDQLAGQLLDEPALAIDTVHRAGQLRLDSALPGSGVQLAAMRVTIASSANTGQLRGWLQDGGLPDGLVLDLDLRWRILIRLSELGEIDRSELRRWLEEETTTQSAVSHTRALASLPDAQAKSYAWERFTGAVDSSNYELEAAGLGMWQRGQENLTGPFVERYFAEVARTVDVRSGWILAKTAAVFFPRLAVDPSTLKAAGRLLDNKTLDASLRRSLIDATHDLRQALAVRQTFAG